MNQRIQSVDFLRGLTIMTMILVNTPGDWSCVYKILLHAPWHGLNLADFVFPFFIFIVGISFSLVYKNKVAEGATYKKILIRSFKLIALGLIINAFIPYIPFFNFDGLRLPGVLQRIGIVFCVVSIAYLNCTRIQLIVVAVVILVGYWLWMVYMPLPDGSLPTLNRALNNWANYLDYHLLKGYLWKPDYDPEGILRTVPSLVSAILGVFVGEILVSRSTRKLILLCGIGGTLLVVSYFWNHFFPINKALWSSSFVLVTAGYGTVLLAIFYYFMDQEKRDFGAIVKYVGANAIFIFFTSSLITKAFYLIQVKNEVSVHSWLFEN
ncbi:acyltransferase family protein [Aquimarina intermedia]|uniref:Putative acyltransferase n=1 Tax=Aquimarina intermedia TaxID=350814 RepID=A0A5S5C9I7_9FLAO|nr:heparan-alpha-glucosaminide N-acetyltransferase domain-containing protein [Aquimarina intermedia]TYP75829.1 putative acyltransferase [Aquimarina intermedia]